MRKFKKRYILIVFFALYSFISIYPTVGEKEDPDADNLNAKLRGTWCCEETPLNQPDDYTGYMVLEIGRTRKFILYDAEGGNFLLCGKIKIFSESLLQMSNFDYLFFEIPYCWETMNKIAQKFDYRLEGENKLYLTYTDKKTKKTCTLVFHQN